MMKNKLMQKNRMMQKNKMMRLGSGLLVLTMLTTCIISGTFAKYVTGDEKSDSARVAKWGVTTNISGALFGAHYNDFEAAEGANQIAAGYIGSVDSHAEGAVLDETAEEENIVAPGTKSENMTISIAGTPEVSGKIEVTVDGAVTEDGDIETPSKNFSDIWLDSGTYAVMDDVTDTVKTEDDIVGLYVKNGEKYEPAASYVEGTDYFKLKDEVELGENTYPTNEDGDKPSFYGDKYYPILWSLYNDSTEGGNPSEHGTYNSVAELAGAIKDNIIGKNNSFKSHANLGTMFGITTINWQWAFETMNADGVVSDVVDGCDTILSKLMAWETTSNYQVVKINDDATITGVTKTSGTDVTYAEAGGEQVACLTVGFNINVTVSQTD